MCLLFKPTLAKYVNNHYYLVLIIPTVSIVTKILSYFWLISPTLTRPVYQDLPNREIYSDFSIHFFIQMGKTHESTMNDKITMKIWNNWNFKQLATTNKKLTWKNCSLLQSYKKSVSWKTFDLWHSSISNEYNWEKN